MKEILGFELRQAGPWMDCLRDVQTQNDGTFKYVHNPKFGASCVDFKEGDEKARMEDYVGPGGVARGADTIDALLAKLKGNVAALIAADP